MEATLHHNLDAMWILIALGLIALSPDVIGYIVDRVQGWFNEKDK